MDESLGGVRYRAPYGAITPSRMIVVLKVFRFCMCAKLRAVEKVEHK